MENRKGKPITVDGWGEVNPGQLRDMQAEKLGRLKSILEVKLAIIGSQLDSAEEKKAAAGEDAQELEWRLRARRAKTLFATLLSQVAAALKHRERVDRITHERSAQTLWYQSFLRAAQETLPPHEFDRLSATADRAAGRLESP